MDAARRLATYDAQYGVRWYWIVNPEARTFEAFQLVENGWLDAGSFDETDVARIPPFEAVELPVGRLFLPRTTPSEG